MSKKILEVNNINNPVLEFDSALHVSTDPIFGLSTWNPCKYPDLDEIKVCAICSPAYKNALQLFWSYLKNGFNEKVFVPFPGFSNVFNISIDDLTDIINPDKKPGDIPTRYASAVKDVSADYNIAIVILPYDFPLEAREVYNETKAASFSKDPRLKTQCIRRKTLFKLDEITTDKTEDEIKYIRSAHSINLWNVAVAIFTKVGGTPWKLKDIMSEVGCFTGIVASTKLLDERRYIKDKVGICEVTDSWGSHVIWAKEALPSMGWAEEEGVRVLDISPDEVRGLIGSCLEKYCRTILGPGYEEKLDTIKDKLLSFHLVDVFSKKVLDEMEKTIVDFGFDKYQIIRLQGKAPARIYDQESSDNLPLRGSYWKEDESKAILYTHGRREYRRGKVRRIYSIHKRVTPIGVEILRQNKGLNIEKVLEQILNLTGLCWYTTNIEIKMPVTIKIARRISDLWKRGVLADFEDVRFVL